MSISAQEMRVIKEKVEVLNGDRGNRRLAALRTGDGQDLREFIAKLRKGTADVQRDLAIAVETQAALAASLATTQDDLATTNSALAAAQDALTALDASLTSISGDVATLETAITTAQDAIDALGDSGATIAADVADIRAGAAAVTIDAATASTVAAPPTAAEHNALLADVDALRVALTAIKAAVAM